MPSNLFLSWSGARSRAAAEAFRVLVVGVINVAQPFLSMNIDKGRRWDAEIRTALAECTCGVVFLCRENLDSHWLLYEAGALARAIEDESNCCTFLIDLKPSDIEQPLGGLQHTVFEPEDVFRLLETINRALGANRATEDLRRSFKAFWPDFDGAIKALPPSPEKQGGEMRSERSILEEILTVVRGEAVARERADPALHSVGGTNISSKEYVDILDALVTGLAAERIEFAGSNVFPSHNGIVVKPTRAADTQALRDYLATFAKHLEIRVTYNSPQGGGQIFLP